MIPLQRSVSVLLMISGNDSAEESYIAVTRYPVRNCIAGQKAKNGHFALCRSRYSRYCRGGGVLFLFR
jgi:hypothetical protein